MGDKPKVNDGGIRQGDIQGQRAGGKSRAEAGNKVNDC